jgi:hypothetical protein
VCKGKTRGGGFSGYVKGERQTEMMVVVVRVLVRVLVIVVVVRDPDL